MTQTTVDQVDLLSLLVEVYHKYTTAQGLPSVSADEQDFNELTESQRSWMEAFQILWEDAESR